MSISNRELLAKIQYPETDGKPMGETDFHIKLIVDISEALRNFFILQPDVLVDTGRTLRLLNPATGEFLLTPEEEAAARQQAEARADRLAAKLREMGIDPDEL